MLRPPLPRLCPRVSAVPVLALLLALLSGRNALAVTDTDLDRLTLPRPTVLGGGAVPHPVPTASARVLPGDEGTTEGGVTPEGAIAARARTSHAALASWVGDGTAGLFQVEANTWTGLPHRLWGPSVSILPGGELGRSLSDAPAAERAARAWLEAHTALWAADEQPGAEDLALVKSQRVGATWFLVFQQRHQGLEVEGGRVDLRVRDDGRLVLFGSDWLPGVTVDTRVQRLARGVSDARARAAIGFDAASDRALGGERIILPLPRADGGLDYRVVDRVRHRTENPPALWRSYVDASSGQIVARENDLRYDTLVGQVTGKVHPTTASDPLVTVPLRDDVVGTALDSVYTAPDGRYSLPGISAGTPIKNGLRGPYAEIVRSVPGSPAQQFNAPPNDTLNFLWQFPQADSSEADAFYHVHVVHQYLRKIQPSFVSLDYRMPVTVNIPSMCNAYWDGVGVNFYRWGIQGTGRACANTGMIADVIYHEYGHGRTQFVFAPFEPSGAMHEGLSDYLAATMTNQSVIGRGFFGPGTSIRNTQNTQKVNDPSCLGEVHCVGNAISGSLWDLRRNLIAAGPDSATAITLADSLFHFAGYGGATWHDDYLLDLLAVDDNDGNLLNGTPHYAQICPAFAGHGINCPAMTSGVWIAHTPLPDAQLTDGPFTVDATMGSSAAAFVPGSATLNWRIQSGAWNPVTMTALGGGAYRGMIPAMPGGGRVDYYLTGADAAANTGASPTGAPASFHTFYVGNVSTVFADNFETDQGWVSQIAGATAGRWMRVDPNGTPDPEFPTFFYQTEDDHTTNPGRFCYVTGDTTAGLDPGQADVDNGCVTLLSPQIDLSGRLNARLEYWRWFTDESRYDDTLFVEVSSNNGTTWVELERQPFTQNLWLQRSFDLGSKVPLTNQFRFRARTCDVGGGSVVEAALDDFVITTRAYGTVDAGLPPAGDGDIPTLAFVGNVQPNPARGGSAARIAFGVPRARDGQAGAKAVLQVVDLRGRLVKTLINDSLAPGRYGAVWDGTNTRGERAGAGVYFARLAVDGQSASGKIVRLD